MLYHKQYIRRKGRNFKNK